mmetsp:Transcript_65910/g.175531  ORF Transcript_65910/g.175531 Transcript_65910/m.175531 type:complete len:203 (-) Transcript_65910:18-626(-)
MPPWVPASAASISLNKARSRRSASAAARSVALSAEVAATTGRAKAVIAQTPGVRPSAEHFASSSCSATSSPRPASHTGLASVPTTGSADDTSNAVWEKAKESKTPSSAATGGVCAAVAAFLRIVRGLAVSELWLCIRLRASTSSDSMKSMMSASVRVTSWSEVELAAVTAVEIRKSARRVIAPLGARACEVLGGVRRRGVRD